MTIRNGGIYYRTASDVTAKQSTPAKVKINIMNYHLWRVGILPEYDWQPKPRAMYVIMSTKEKAKEYAEKHLKKPYKVGKISRLGKRLGGCMFRG